jgi:hypothetical protein
LFAASDLTLFTNTNAIMEILEMIHSSEPLAHKVVLGMLFMFVGALIVLAQTGPTPTAPSTSTSRPSASIPQPGRPVKIVSTIPSTPPTTLRSPISTNPAPRSFVSEQTRPLDWNAKWALNNSIVLVEGSTPSISLTAVDGGGNPVSNVKWEVQRNPNDNAKLRQNPYPTTQNLSIATQPGSTTTQNLQLNAIGSFRVTAYVDVGNIGHYVDGNPAIFYHVIVCRVRCVEEKSVPLPDSIEVGISTFGYDVDGVGVWPGDAFAISFGKDTKDRPDLAGVNFKSTVQIVGGGDDGCLGVDRVFCGWVNNGTYLESTGSYENGHSTSVYMPNENWEGPPNYVTATLPNGNYHDMAPPLSTTHPLLDTAEDMTAGRSICMSKSLQKDRISVAAPGIGQQCTVEARDYPALSAATLHPAFNGSKILEYGCQENFTAKLIVWTQLLNDVGAQNLAGPTLYSCVNVVPWKCEARVKNMTYDVQGVLHWPAFDVCNVTLEQSNKYDVAVPLTGAISAPKFTSKYNLRKANN